VHGAGDLPAGSVATAAATLRASGAPGQALATLPGTVGHNAFRTDFGIAFGGFKQSGIGREGGHEVCCRSWRPRP